MKTFKENLFEKPLEELIDVIHEDYKVGRTAFDTPDKKYICVSYYRSAAEYGEIPEEEFFEVYDKKDLPTFYGHTAKEAVIKAIIYSINEMLALGDEILRF